MQSPPDFQIVYASQTGTSQALAESLFRAAHQKSFNPELFSIDAYPVVDLPSCIVPIVFLISTTGQGAPTNSMIKFWKFLLIKGLPSDCLKTLKYILNFFNLFLNCYFKIPIFCFLYVEIRKKN
jgi:sulfite reductase alpha subunit-like flavoprotein